MNKLISPTPIAPKTGLTVIRIVLGLFLIYHGWEVFDATKMKEYTTWDVFKTNPSPSFMVYMGKTAELVAGILLLIGLFTRVGAIIVIATFTYIAFFVGNGRIWNEDQHPFLFVLLGFVFFFTGPGYWSADNIFFHKTIYKGR